MTTCSKCGAAFERAAGKKTQLCPDCQHRSKVAAREKYRDNHRDELRKMWRQKAFEKRDRLKAQLEKRREAKRQARAAALRSCRKCGSGLPPSAPLGVPKTICTKCKALGRREYMAANPKKRADYRRKADWRKQGIVMSVAEYDRRWALQGGRCAICGSDKAARDKKNLCVDHDHDFGHVRGLLCCSCNRGIGALKHSPQILRAAAKYLEQNQPKLGLA